LVISGTKFIQKWKNIKDHYTKSEKKKCKSGQAANTGRRYIYAQQLSFLQTAGATTNTQSSLDHEAILDQQDSEDHQEPHYSNLDLDGSECPPRYKQNSTKKRKNDIESSLVEFMNTPIPTTPPIVPEINPDRSFFESLLPSISSFTKDQKLEFRCEILNIIKRMRNQPAVQQYGYPPNNPHYKPAHTYGQNMNPYSSYIELSRLTQPNQCPTSITQFRTPLSTQLSQTTSTGVPTISPTSSTSASMDNQYYSEEDSIDLFRD